MASAGENTASGWSTHTGFYASHAHSVLGSASAALLTDIESLVAFDVKDANVLDNGAGSGNTTLQLKTKYPSLQVLAADLSPGMLENLQAEAGQHADWTLIETRVANAEDLSASNIKDSQFSHVVSTFMLPFCSDPARALREMYRVLRPAGVIGIGHYTYGTPSWTAVWEATVRTYFSQPEHYDTKRASFTGSNAYHIDTYNPKLMQKTMEEAGFVEVSIRTFNAYHPEKTAIQAAEEMYSLGRGNPGTVELFKPFQDEELEAMRDTFKDQWNKMYDGGKKKQFEVTLLTTARKPLIR